MKKLIDFKEQASEIQDYANKHCNGNFTEAVRKLVARGLPKVTVWT